MAKNITKIVTFALTVFLLLFLSSCAFFEKNSDTELTAVEDPESDITLKQLAEDNNILVGSAINYIALNHPTDPYVGKYKQLLAQEFNLVTPECSLRMDKCWLSPDNINFTNVDIEAQFASDNNQKMRGHLLLWYRSVPDWLSDGYNSGEYSSLDVENMVKNYIKSVIDHFNINWSGLIESWIVVNEAIGPDQPISANGVYGIREPDEDFWVKSIGADYVAKAFNWAREADSEAKLYYNDFKCEFYNPKSDPVYNFVKQLINDGVPIDGMGMQCHFSLKFLKLNYTWLDFSIESMSEIFDKYAELGLDIAVTEMDIAVNYDNSGLSTDRLTDQADFYYLFAKMALSKPNLTSLCLWGFTDRLSWLNTDTLEEWPLIFDKELNKKESYIELRRAFMEQVQII